jgi:bifunctional DNA-binding transcriptional regulator/antitoxin component of YhaV-PrlF toxin-antitoxin module
VFSPSDIELPLPTIQLHYDGWLTLPVEARQHLDVTTGDRLDIGLTEAGLFIRSARQVAALEPAAAVAPPTAAPAEAFKPVKAETATVRRGRPRKAVTPDLAAPTVKIGGRRKSLPAGTA